MNSTKDRLVTTIDPGVHMLLGIGVIQYIYTRQPYKLLINISNQEVAAINGELAKEIYHRLIGILDYTDPLIDKINDICLKAFKMSLMQLTIKTRKQEICEPRQVLMWYLSNELKLNNTAIGRMLNNFDSHTVKNAIEKIEKMKNTDPSIKENINKLEKAIKQI